MGGGLYLQVSRGGAKSWIFRFMLDGRSREMAWERFTRLPSPRHAKRAVECRRMRHDGIDPIEARRTQRDERKLGVARSMTFDACAAAYIDVRKAGWKNAKHRNQWPNTLNAYASPVFGSLPMQAVDAGLVMKALEPIWQTKSETASRLRADRGRPRLGYRSQLSEGDNPARWRGHLDKVRPGRSKVRRVEHHPALPYDEFADFGMPRGSTESRHGRWSS
jgi:hypothetical protein